MLHKLFDSYAMKGLLVLLITATVVAGMAGCAGPAGPAQEAEPAEEVEQAEEVEPAEEVTSSEQGDKVLKVGVMAPYTGSRARVGEELKGAAELAFEDIDYKVGDYTIELVWVDSQGDPEKATRAYEEAVVRHGIDVGLMGWQSPVSLAVMEICARNKIPHFFAFGAAHTINEKINSDLDRYSYWMGKGWPDPKKLTSAYIATVNSAIEGGLWKPDVMNAGVYAEDTDWGRSLVAGMIPQLEEAGWTIVAEEYFQSAETEFYPLLTKMMDADVRLIAGTANSPSPEALVKQAHDTELPALVILDGLGWIGEWYEMTGDASDYAIDQIPQWPTEESAAFRDRFDEKYGFAPSPSAAGQAFDVTNYFIEILKKTLEEHGELTSATIHQTGMDYVYTGKLPYKGVIHEEWVYTPETWPDPVVGEGKFIFPVIQYFGGEGVIVWPDAWKQADLAIPDWVPNE